MLSVFPIVSADVVIDSKATNNNDDEATVILTANLLTHEDRWMVLGVHVAAGPVVKAKVRSPENHAEVGPI